jgi:hypothetical protein
MPAKLKGEVLFPFLQCQRVVACVDPSAPSPPASFGAMESGGEPGCIGVDLGLVASIPGNVSFDVV